MAIIETLSVLGLLFAGSAYQQTVKVEEVDKSKVNTVSLTDGVIVTVGDQAVYQTCVGWTDSNNKPKTTTGYVKKEDFDALNVKTVSIPANFAGLEAEMVPARLSYQLFRITEVVENEDYVEVTARHVWYDNLKNYTLWEADKETNYSAGYVCRNILTNTISPTSSRVATDCTDTKIGKEFDYKNKNLVEAFLDPENGVCAKFGLNLIRYNWDFYCLKDVGYNRGFIVENGKNLLGVERTESIENLVTRCAPIGKDSSGNIVWLNNNGVKYVDSQYISNYSCPHVEIYDTGLKIGEGDVTADNIQAKLLEAGQNRFINDKVDLPEVEMTIEFLSLGDTEEYSQYRGLDKVYLYDIITIHDTVRGYDYTAQVVGIEHDILTGMLKSVTIGKLNNWDGTRKIATWQVPEVDGTNIRLLSIQAGAFAPGAINSDDLANGSILRIHLASATIDNLTTEALNAAYANIHDLIAGRIIADDISAGAITTDKLQANAVTAAKIAADAITAEKIQAGAINANKIDANDISAINAKLGTAAIADARIGVADINYAHIKDLDAQSAFFGQTVFNEAVGGKLYVPRLAVGYAQMLGATISDLVIQASNDNYYKLDVDLSGNVTATQMTPTAEEIAQGYTNDGRTIYMGTDILATDLNTQNIYASHGLMDQITANIINVDKLFAREATIGVINALDLRSNTYIQSVVGNWQSQSTITQTIDGINSRITSLGYGTFYYSTTEPSPSGVVVGDVWIQPIDDQTWDDVSQYTWDELASFTWEQVAGQYRMYVWTGTQWKLLFDNLVINELQTEIAQTAYAVTLKADKSVVDTLSDEVTEFGATLEVQAEAISAAVSSVNYKSANYTRLTDPADDPNISLNVGDMWTKAAGNGTWGSLESYTWDELANLTWDELAGSKVYTWNGTEWIQSADAGATILNRALIEESDRQITLLVEETTSIGQQVDRNTASITIQADRITQEVERATNAENGKISKTTQYQTADAIVSEAISQSATSAAGLYLAKTTSYQTADAIVTEAVQQANATAGNSYLAKTSTYQTAESIKNEAVRASGVNASKAYLAKSGIYTTVDSIIGEAQTLASNAATTAKDASIAKTDTYQTADAIVSAAVAAAETSAGATYIAKTTSYQTADSIVSAAETYTNNQLNNYSTTTQTASMISAAVGDCYGKVSGIGITSAGVDISGSQYVAIASGGWFKVTTGDFGIDTSQSGICMWAGASSAVTSPFRLKKDGTVYLTKLIAVAEDGTESEVNLRTAGLWKLNYHTVKSVASSGGYCTGMTLSNGTTVNFKSAATVYTVAARVASAPADYTATWTVETDLSNGVSMTVALSDTYGPLKALYNSGWNDAVDNMLVLGTVYRITAHMNEWVKVEAIGTGYTNPGYIN
jgi:phage minor structural protein